jgi:hypothetical protein
MKKLKITIFLILIIFSFQQICYKQKNFIIHFLRSNTGDTLVQFDFHKQGIQPLVGWFGFTLGQGSTFNENSTSILVIFGSNKIKTIITETHIDIKAVNRSDISIQSVGFVFS